jgi:hypothetical protein
MCELPQPESSYTHVFGRIPQLQRQVGTIVEQMKTTVHLSSTSHLS